MGDIQLYKNGCMWVSCGGRMVIVPAFYTVGQGSIPGRVEMFGSVSVNHSLTRQSCKMVPVNVGTGIKDHCVGCLEVTLFPFTSRLDRLPAGKLSEKFKPPLTEVCLKLACSVCRTKLNIYFVSTD